MYAVLLFLFFFFANPPPCPPCPPMQLIRAKGTSWLCHRHGNTRIKLLGASLPLSEPSPHRHLEIMLNLCVEYNVQCGWVCVCAQLYNMYLHWHVGIYTYPYANCLETPIKVVRLQQEPEPLIYLSGCGRVEQRSVCTETPRLSWGGLTQEIKNLSRL